MRAQIGLWVILLAGCPTTEPPPDVDLSDDPTRYIEDVRYRRGVLERDLLERDNRYAQQRVSLYAREGQGWEVLPSRDRPSRHLSVEDTELLQTGELSDLDVSELLPIVPATVPDDGEEWINLGRQVVSRYPLRADRVYETLAAIPGGLERAGFFTRPDGTWVGLAVFEDDDGSTRIGPTCAQCHCSPTEYGIPSPTVANKAMDVGAANLLVLGFDPDERPTDVGNQSILNHYDLGPGRVDVLPDGEFNPYALPDFGGLADMPYLQQNGGWAHGGLATVAIRAETLFITSNNERSRIPRVLSWAAGAFYRSWGPPTPLDSDPGPEAAAGEDLFESVGCDECHAPPLYTSDLRIPLDEVGTDPSAGESDARYTGFYRVPSLRGVGRTGPYLHHGAVPTLDDLFSPDRQEPGHLWGTELDEDERAQLVAFLRSI